MIRSGTQEETRYLPDVISSVPTIASRRSVSGMTRGWCEYVRACRSVHEFNTCADYTDEHGYARRRNFLSPNPEVSRIGVSKTLTCPPKPVSAAARVSEDQGVGGSALIRLTCPPKSDSAAVRVSEDQGEGGSAKIRARIHLRGFAATVFNFNYSCCVISITP